MRERANYIRSSAGWSAELLVMFLAGFVAATMLWLGLWLFQAKPAQAVAIEAKETALQKCVAAKELCDVLRSKTQADQEEASKKLDQALAGWGRCIRNQSAPQTEGTEGAGEEGTS